MSAWFGCSFKRRSSRDQGLTAAAATKIPPSGVVGIRINQGGSDGSEGEGERVGRPTGAEAHVNRTAQGGQCRNRDQAAGAQARSGRTPCQAGAGRRVTGCRPSSRRTGADLAGGATVGRQGVPA